MSVSPIPPDYPRLSPAAAVTNCAKAVDFYKSVFGAVERMRLSMPDGSVAHVELAFGDSVLMMGEANADAGWPATTLRLSLYVADCDETYRRALAAGATSRQEPADQFYGDRQARVLDPWGFEWSLVTRVRNMTLEEMESEMKKLFG